MASSERLIMVYWKSISISFLYCQCTTCKVVHVGEFKGTWTVCVNTSMLPNLVLLLAIVSLVLPIFPGDRLLISFTLDLFHSPHDQQLDWWWSSKTAPSFFFFFFLWLPQFLGPVTDHHVNQLWRTKSMFMCFLIVTTMLAGLKQWVHESWKVWKLRLWPYIR